MAIKAGLVGVNPKGVDKNGMPIAGSMIVGDKHLKLVYDESDDKYGFKIDGKGDFIPFDGAGGAGWVRPADLTVKNTVANGCTIEAGGYVIKDGMLYVDMLIHTNDSVDNDRNILILNVNSAYIPYMGANYINSPDSFDDYQIQATAVTANVNTAYKINVRSDANYYEHIFGQTKIS